MRPAFSKDQMLEECKVLQRHETLRLQFDADYSRSKLAQQMGVSTQLLGRWINGKSPVPAPQLIRLGELMGFNAKDVRPDLQMYDIDHPHFKMVMRLRSLPFEQYRALDLILNIFERHNK